MTKKLDQATAGVEEPSPNGAAPEDTRLPWRWAHDLAAAAPASPDWLLEGYVAPGAKLLVAGLPKAGKTTLVAAMVEAIASGTGAFLGRTVRGGPVLLASEEGDGTLAPKLAGMPAEGVRVLNRDAVWPKPSWAEMIADAVREAQETGAVLLVVDSVAFWAALEPEREKDAGAMQALLDALDEACRAGLAVLLVHHQRKAPGEHGTGVRGSGALAGAVDVIVEFERQEDAPSTQRRLVALSRWPETPGVLVVDRCPATSAWRVVGEAGSRDAAAELGTREQLLDAVPADPPGATEPELANLVGVDKRKVGKPLRELVDEGLVSRSGAGKRGDPYAYQKVPQKGAPTEGRNTDSVSALPLRGAERNQVRPEDAAPLGAETRGCASHPEPVASCRYCQLAEEAAP